MYICICIYIVWLCFFELHCIAMYSFTFASVATCWYVLTHIYLYILCLLLSIQRSQPWSGVQTQSSLSLSLSTQYSWCILFVIAVCGVRAARALTSVNITLNIEYHNFTYSLFHFLSPTHFRLPLIASFSSSSSFSHFVRSIAVYKFSTNTIDGQWSMCLAFGASLLLFVYLLVFLFISLSPNLI